MRYLSIAQIPEKWRLSPRWVNDLCSGGRIPNAMEIGSYRAIPEDTGRPKSAHVKSDRYIKDKR